MIEFALWALVLLPALVGGALALSRLERGAVVVSLAMATAMAALSAVVAVHRPQVAVPFVAGSDIALGVDGLSAMMVPTVAGITLLVLVFATGDIRESRARFHGLMLVFASAALVTATAQTLPALLMGWEVMGALSFALIGFWWRDDHRVSSGTVAFLTTRTADLGIYLAAGAAIAGGAGLVLADLPASSAGWRHVVAAGMLVAALGKAAQLPFSFWLSRAMDGPSPVSALLHSAAMVAMGGYLLLRVQPLLASTGWASPTTAWMGAATAVAMGVVAVAQRDLKQLLAASTSAQLGFVVMGAGLASISGGAVHLVAHASTKALLFLVAGAWLSALGTKRLAALRGTARRWRLVGWAATVGALSLAGVAPLALWATKDAVLAAALEQSPALYAVGLAGAALSAAYAARILAVVWRRVPAAERAGVDAHLDEEQEGTRRVGVWEKVPLVVLAVGAGVLGWLALPPLDVVVSRAVGGAPVTPSVRELALSALVAVAVVVLVWWRQPRQPAWARQWLGLERAAHTVVVRPTLWLAERCARFDDGVLDRLVEAAPRLGRHVATAAARFDDGALDTAVDAASRRTLRLADRSAVADDRGIDATVEAVAGRLRSLGRLARRPQTGQVHQYYIQAVAVIAIGVLLLVTVR